MKIFLDARNPRFNGSWTYMEGLIPALAAAHPEDDFIVLYDRVHGKLGLPGVDERVARGLSPAAWIAWTHTVLPRILDREGVDLYHGLKQINSIRTRARTVYTVHGATHFVYPQLHGRINVRYWKGVTTAAGRRTADQLIAVSEADKRNLVFWGGVPEERISVTNLAVSPRFRVIEDGERREQVRRRLGLDFPFVLFVGRVDPFKNVIGIIRAFARAVQTRDTGHHLVIAGGTEGKHFGEVSALVEASGLSNRIHFIGHLSEDLEILFNLADAFLFPSLYEAFPLALAEALNCGLPIISSSAGGCPEVLGEAGIIVNPIDIDEMAGALVRVLSSPDLRADMRERSLARAGLFSWDRCAQETFDVYRRVVGE